MLLSHVPAWLAGVFGCFASWLDRRSAARLPRLLGGILLAAGRHTATAWFRAGGISDDFRRAYHTIHAVGCRTEPLAFSAWTAARPCLEGCRRLLVAIDDTPTSRYGPCVEGAGIHHNPSPGPAGEKFVCGHVWVTLAGLAKHPAWGTVALPLEASLYVRRKDLAQLPPERKWVFDAARRPSHADKRKALQREVLRQEIQAALAGRPNKQRFRNLAERLMDLAS